MRGKKEMLDVEDLRYEERTQRSLLRRGERYEERIQQV